MSDPTVDSLLAVSDGLFLVFDDSGELCDWNQTVVERTAADPESLSTMTPGDIVANEEANTMQDAIEALDETERTTVETVLVTDAGARRHYEFTVQQLTEADGEPTSGAIGRDITERKRAQQERAAIFDRMSDGVFAVDTEWHITYANAFGATVLSAAMGRELTVTEGADGVARFECRGV